MLLIVISDGVAENFHLVFPYTHSYPYTLSFEPACQLSLIYQLPHRLPAVVVGMIVVVEIDVVAAAVVVDSITDKKRFIRRTHSIIQVRSSYDSSSYSPHAFIRHIFV